MAQETVELLGSYVLDIVIVVVLALLLWRGAVPSEAGLGLLGALIGGRVTRSRSSLPKVLSGPSVGAVAVLVGGAVAMVVAST